MLGMAVYASGLWDHSVVDGAPMWRSADRHTIERRTVGMEFPVMVVGVRPAIATYQFLVGASKSQFLNCFFFFTVVKNSATIFEWTRIAACGQGLGEFARVGGGARSKRGRNDDREG